MIIGHLNITSYRGISFGAVHWYGKLHIADNHDTIEDIELTRPLTAKDASALNSERQSMGYSYCLHTPGDMTEGFNTENSALRAGIKTAKAGSRWSADLCSPARLRN